MLEIPTDFRTVVATGMGDDRCNRKEYTGGNPVKRQAVLTGPGISTLAASLTPRIVRTAQDAAAELVVKKGEFSARTEDLRLETDRHGCIVALLESSLPMSPPIVAV
jgi:hypothetical protein